MNVKGMESLNPLPHKMVNTLPTNCLSLSDHFIELELKVLNRLVSVT